MALDYVAKQIGDDEMLWPHVLIRDAAWLDDDQSFGTRNAAGIAECIEDQPLAHEFEVGFEDLFLQMLQHGLSTSPQGPGNDFIQNVPI